MLVFSTFLSSRIRTVSSAVQDYIQGLFQVWRGTQLRMNEEMETNSRALNHLLTKAAADWKSLIGKIARQYRQAAGQHAQTLQEARLRPLLTVPAACSCRRREAG